MNSDLLESTRQECKKYYDEKKDIIDHLAQAGNLLEQKAARTIQIAAGVQI